LDLLCSVTILIWSEGMTITNDTVANEIINGQQRDATNPFEGFAPAVRPQSDLRRAITAAFRTPETICVPRLVDAATLPEKIRRSAAATARKLIEALRAPSTRELASKVSSMNIPFQARKALRSCVWPKRCCAFQTRRHAMP
jgi:Proline utilization A proline dehydrogenase N-terminal domain